MSESSDFSNLVQQLTDPDSSDAAFEVAAESVIIIIEELFSSASKVPRRGPLRPVPYFLGLSGFDPRAKAEDAVYTKLFIFFFKPTASENILGSSSGSGNGMQQIPIKETFKMFTALLWGSSQREIEDRVIDSVRNTLESDFANVRNMADWTTVEPSYVKLCCNELIAENVARCLRIGRLERRIVGLKKRSAAMAAGAGCRARAFVVWLVDVLEEVFLLERFVFRVAAAVVGWYMGVQERYMSMRPLIELRTAG